MVIGAGATGKASAIALARAGHTVHIFDGKLEPGMAGGALMLWSNAVRALNELLGTEAEPRAGEAKLLKAGGLVMRRMDFRTFEGSKLYSMSIKQLSDEAKAPSLLVDRRALQNLLAESTDHFGQPPKLGEPRRITIELGREFWTFRIGGSQVEVEFLSGPTARGDLLLGAEGGRSRVRSRLLGPPRHRSTRQYVAFGYSTAASQMAPPGVCYVLMDAHHRFFAAGLPGWDGGTVKWRTYWGASVPMGLATPGDPCGRPFTFEALCEAFEGAAPEVGRILEGSDDRPKKAADEPWAHQGSVPSPPPAPRWWAVESRDLPPGGTWHRGRVGLLGDAAHLMTYDLGQGQAMGFEDAVELGRCIRRFPSDPTPALGSFETARRHRVGAITELSYRAAQVSTPGSDVLASLRDFATAHLYAPVNEQTMRFMLRGGLAPYCEAAIA